MAVLYSPGGAPPLLPSEEPHEDNTGQDVTPISGSYRAYAKYPPQVTIKRLGGFVDVSGHGFPKDVGRSSVIGNRVFFQFGATHWKDGGGKLVALIDNTCANVPDRGRPMAIQFLDLDDNGRAKQFLPYMPAEREQRQRRGGNHARLFLSSHGGIAQETPERGWCWFSIGAADLDGNLAWYGTGVARVDVDPLIGMALASRPVDILFERDEPHWGTFSTLVEGGYVHLWGLHHRDLMLARVPVDKTLEKAAYEYWNGQEYVGDSGAARPVVSRMSQGTIYRSRLFPPGRGMDYVFLGVSQEATSKMLVSVAPALEGPWREWHELFTRPAAVTQEAWKYCMYPHPWAFEEREGKLLMTWCDHTEEGFVAAKLKFEMGPRLHYHKCSITDTNPEVLARLATSPALQEIADLTMSTITCPTLEAMTGRENRGDAAAGYELTAIGPTPANVAEAAMLIQRTVDVWSRAARDQNANRERRAKGFMPQILGLFAACFPFKSRRRERDNDREE